MGRHAEALKLREETLTLRKAKLGPDHPDTLASMNNLASEYVITGRHAMPSSSSKRRCALLKAKLGPDHPDTLLYMNNLAISYDDLGRHAEALELYEETMALMKTKLGPDHRATLSCRSWLSRSYASAGQHADAARITEESLSLRKAKFGADHPDTLGTMSSLANYYAAFGRHGEALKLREELLAIQKAKLGPDHADTLSTMNSVLSSYEALGQEKLDEAIDKYRAAYRLEPDSTFARKQLAGALNRRSWILATDPDPEKRDPDRAVKLATEVVELTPKVADCWNNLGVARYRNGDFEGAIAALQKFRELCSNDQEWSNPFFLAMAHWQLGKMDEAQQWFETAVNWMDAKAPTSELLIRFRAEAAELLGVDEKKETEPSSAPTQ